MGAKELKEWADKQEDPNAKLRLENKELKGKIKYLEEVVKNLKAKLAMPRKDN